MAFYIIFKWVLPGNATITDYLSTDGTVRERLKTLSHMTATTQLK